MNKIYYLILWILVFLGSLLFVIFLQNGLSNALIWYNQIIKKYDIPLELQIESKEDFSYKFAKWMESYEWSEFKNTNSEYNSTGWVYNWKEDVNLSLYLWNLSNNKSITEKEKQYISDNQVKILDYIDFVNWNVFKEQDNTKYFITESFVYKNWITKKFNWYMPHSDIISFMDYLTGYGIYLIWEKRENEATKYIYEQCNLTNSLSKKTTDFLWQLKVLSALTKCKTGLSLLKKNNINIDENIINAEKKI